LKHNFFEIEELEYATKFLENPKLIRWGKKGELGVLKLILITQF
jgi:hypothetical protein